MGENSLIDVSTGGMLVNIFLDKDFDMDKLIALIDKLSKDQQRRISVNKI